MSSRVVEIAGILLLATHLASAVLVSTGVSAEATARVWFQEHKAPTGDELAELKAQNPTAYAIVKALLTKRSLGLLDPRHPSASFAAPPPKEIEDAHVAGADAFAKFAKPGEMKVAPAVQSISSSAASQTAMYPEVSAPQHHDWLNWRPQQSALDDDTMVKNVLGAVAELKGKSANDVTKPLLARHRSENTSPLAADEMEMDLTEDENTRQEGSSELKRQSSASAMAASSPVLDLNAFSKDVQEGNPYTEALGLGGQPSRPVVAAAPEAKAQEAPESALGNWLGVKSSVQTRRAKTTPKPEAENPYLSALNA